MSVIKSHFEQFQKILQESSTIKEFLNIFQEISQTNFSSNFSSENEPSSYQDFAEDITVVLIEKYCALFPTTSIDSDNNNNNDDDESSTFTNIRSFLVTLSAWLNSNNKIPTIVVTKDEKFMQFFFLVLFPQVMDAELENNNNTDVAVLASFVPPPRVNNDLSTIFLRIFYVALSQLGTSTSSMLSPNEQQKAFQQLSVSNAVVATLCEYLEKSVELDRSLESFKKITNTMTPDQQRAAKKIAEVGGKRTQNICTIISSCVTKNAEVASIFLSYNHHQNNQEEVLVDDREVDRRNMNIIDLLVNLAYYYGTSCSLFNGSVLSVPAAATAARSVMFSLIEICFVVNSAKELLLRNQNVEKICIVLLETTKLLGDDNVMPTVALFINNATWDCSKELREKFVEALLTNFSSSSSSRSLVISAGQRLFPSFSSSCSSSSSNQPTCILHAALLKCDSAKKIQPVCGAFGNICLGNSGDDDQVRHRVLERHPELVRAVVNCFDAARDVDSAVSIETLFCQLKDCFLHRFSSNSCHQQNQEKISSLEQLFERSGRRPFESLEDIEDEIEDNEIQGYALSIFKLIRDDIGVHPEVIMQYANPCFIESLNSLVESGKLRNDTNDVAKEVIQKLQDKLFQEA